MLLSLVIEFLKSSYCDIFIFGLLLERVGVLQFHLSLTLYSVSVSDPGRSDVSLLQETCGTEKALGVRHGSRWICPFR